MALAFDEFGRPFIILREQEKMTHLWGMHRCMDDVFVEKFSKQPIKIMHLTYKDNQQKEFSKGSKPDPNSCHFSFWAGEEKERFVSEKKSPRSYARSIPLDVLSDKLTKISKIAASKTKIYMVLQLVNGGELFDRITHNVTNELMKYHSQTLGYVIGGTNMRSDANHLTEGTNILIATLDRLLDHLQNTGSFKYKELKSTKKVGPDDKLAEFTLLDPKPPRGFH
ncbi:putative DEAD-box ATP-dependent RNA helicase 51 [Zea mays]|uniref:Putative DEAD-box ATP-dependent RNA helicase 51 n=1 Tax=Zea mays TaxID=4577 RepID=A0A3L6F941_MAIZE|nr:putative DEAD-box ATP-dependent RNA helicase 51 [Zea mays]